MSLTVTVNVQLIESAEHVTVVVPTAKSDPEGGEQTGVHEPFVVGGGYVTVAPHWLGSFAWMTLAGQVIILQPTS